MAATKKKILHVVRQYAPAIGGLESYVQSMAKHQQAQGYDCQVLTLNRVFHGQEGILPADETIEGVRVHRVPFFGKRRYFIPQVAPSYFKQFDIIHVHNTDVFFDYVALLSWFIKAPCFATTHGGFFHTKDFSLIKTLYFNTLTRFSAFWYKAIFAISRNDFNTFKSLNKNLIYQPNAIEPLGDEIVQGDDFVYIGRLAKHKNIAELIKVFAVLKLKYTVPGTLHIIGPEWDVTIQELKAVAKTQMIEEWVKFHGSATTKDMHNIVKTCGYFASASAFEGFGMSMLEGMSVGLIPLVHDNESFLELVQQSGVGVCTDFGKADQAADIIHQAMAKVTPDHKKSAREFALKFSWKGLVEEAAKTYERFTA